MSSPAHTLAQSVKKTIESTEIALDALRKAQMDMGHAVSNDAEELEQQMTHSDAADAFGFYILRLYRDIALLAEALGLPKVCDQIRQATPKPEKAHEVHMEENGIHSDYLRHALHWFSMLEEAYLGHPTNGLSVFETILENSGKILEASGTVPHNEAAVRRPVLDVLEYAFADAVREVSIPKASKVYKFDIGIVSLKAVAEFKFVDSEADAKSALDHIYTDMKGYSGSSDWRQFYAVFYMTGPFFTPKDLQINFKLVSAERNWTPIPVYGPGSRKKS